MTITELKDYLNKGCILYFASDSIEGGITSLGEPKAGKANITIRCAGSNFQGFEDADDVFANFRIGDRLFLDIVPDLDFEAIGCFG